MTTFALVGAAGFVAPRHLQAIRDVGGELVAALDPHDSVGVLDRYGFRNADFFTAPERFERHLAKMAHTKPLDWLVVCSPNYLHDTHIRMGLNVGAQVLCEKPLVLTPANLDELYGAEARLAEAGLFNQYKPAPFDAHKPRVFTVLQLRHMPQLQELHEDRKARAHLPYIDDVELVYVTPRGRWYDHTWKGDPAKSGGLIVNIGIHMLDLLVWIWGPPPKTLMFDEITWDDYDEEKREHTGQIRLEHARVKFRLSISGETAARRLVANGREIDFTTGFENLHTTVYRETLAGRGHTIADARPAIELAWRLRR
jgi:UDP-N-acetyl-2-amino-2-deoxyglucuronate dehydrogenase